MNRQRVIKNRDISVLRSVRWLDREMASICRDIQRQKDGMTRCTPRYGRTAAPGSRVMGGYEQALEALCELEERQYAILREYAGRMNRAQDVLNGIADDRIRLFVRLYYLEGMTIEEVMTEVKLTKRYFYNLRGRIERAEHMQDLT